MRDRDPVAREEVAQLVRQIVFRHFVSHSCPPGVRTIAQEGGLTVSETTLGLHDAARPGVITLAQGTDRVWMANPFSALPTMHEVVCGVQRYWAPCAMDALTVGVLLEADTDIHSRCGDCGQRIDLEIRGGQLFGDALFHCPLPPSHWFDNIGFTCQTSLFFADRPHLLAWCERNHLPVAETATAHQLFEVCRHLTGSRLDKHFHQPSQATRLDVFARAGLDGEFWQSSRLRHPPGQEEDPAPSPPPTPPEALALARLSDREMEVLSLLADARSQKQIAHALSLSIHTVDTHIRNIYVKLKAHSRAAAVATAMRAGLV